MYTISRPRVATEAQVQGLSRLLIDCVEGGASVSFMHPLSVEKALDFWRMVAAAVAKGERALLLRKMAKASSARCNSSSISLKISRTAPICRRCSSIAGRGVRDWAPPCCWPQRILHATAENHCWCSTRRAAMPNDSTRSLAGSAAA